MRVLRPSAADWLLAAGSFVLGVVVAITLEAVDFDGERSVDLWAIALLGAMSAPLLARRRWPILVVLAVVLLYVILYSFKLSRLEREVAELTELAQRRRAA